MNSRRNFLKKSSMGAGLLSLPVLPTLPADGPDDLRITEVKALAYKEGSDRAMFVRIETNEGTVGWGECSPNGLRVIQTLVQDELAKLIIGKNPFDTEKLWEEMFWVNHDLGSGGALSYAIAGVDAALWDIKGKILGVPVYQLIGGKFRESVPAYGGFGIYRGQTPVKKAIETAVKLAERGFRTIKIRSQIRENNLNLQDDPSVEYYRAIRRELPDEIDLFLDPNEGYTAYRAIQVGRALQDMGMKYYESPCPYETLADTAQVVNALDIPVMAGEKCYTRWMNKDLILQANPDMINPDFAKSGGITEGLKICALAQVFYKPVVPHNTKPTLASAATMQILAAIPNCGPLVEYIDTDIYPGVCALFDEGIRFENGEMRVPQQPGLGLVINEGRAKKLFGY